MTYAPNDGVTRLCGRMKRMKMSTVVALLGAVLLGGCATQSLSLAPSDIGQIKIVGIDIAWNPDAQIRWAEAEARFLQKIDASPELSKKYKATIQKARFTDNNDDINQIAQSQAVLQLPEAKAHLQAEVNALLRKELTSRVLPRFQGKRAVRLRLTMVGFHVASAAQRVLVGVSHVMGAITEIVDEQTGRVLGKMDRGTGAADGNGVIGVLVSQAFEDPSIRLAANYADQINAWLQPPT